MAHSKISVTVPDEILNEVKRMASEREIKISRLIAEALAEKVRRTNEEHFVSKINKIFEDPEVSGEQHNMAEDIARNADVKELTW
jgi:metal-responsive CopG/Arc/MetJ family transcriptional regulator